MRSFQSLYDRYAQHRAFTDEIRLKASIRPTAIQQHTGRGVTRVKEETGGFKIMSLCRQALEAIDRFEGGKFKRSFHQREFHENFIRACARIFWKTEPPGAFARDHQKILEYNGWSNLTQEVLISTPRRFGKTFAVSMFAAAMLYSTPSLEMSIYSTCKRISQKLLRNVCMFLSQIHDVMGTPEMEKIKFTQEEIEIKGPYSKDDLRRVNSYPSKVETLKPVCSAPL